MDITFSIQYKAQWGEKLCICGSISELVSWDEANAVELEEKEEGTWRCTVSVDGRKKEFTYCYLVKDHRGEVVRREWKRMHRLAIKYPFRRVLMHDNWVDRPANSPFYSSAFYDVLYRHEPMNRESCHRQISGEVVTLQMYAPTIPSGHRLFVTGNTEKLGRWDTSLATEMKYVGKGEWSAAFSINREVNSYRDVYFKLFVRNEAGEIVRWEGGEDHYYELPAYGIYDGIYVSGRTFNEGSYRPRIAGAVIPVFSLRDAEDFGIGDFGSLRKAIDWAKTSGLHVLQILPINDTTYYRDWRDSYPYNAISVDALHPIYMDLNVLPALKNPEVEIAFRERAKQLRQQPSLDYPEVMRLKEEYLRRHYKDHGAETMRRKPFRYFLQQNFPWLTPYAIFCVLRDKYPNQHFDQWGIYSSYIPSRTPYLFEREEEKDNTNFYRYIQFLLYTQLRELCSYAEQRGVLLKGDIPIGVAPHSVNVWTDPHLFHRHLSVGAPPDAFAEDGQNWGFPTYNWPVMQEDGLLWWRGRLERMATFFKSFRVDHILGFFRIWEIPRDQESGLLGHFSPAKPFSLNFWRDLFDEHISSIELIQPIIHRIDLEQVLGVHFSSLLEQGWLYPIKDSDHYTLKYTKQRSYDTVPAEHFAGGEASKQRLRDLCREVALIQDPHLHGHYHPRIAFENSLLFARWSEPLQALWCKVSQHYFYEVHNEFWKTTALERVLLLLECTDMLVCAEDLGMIPRSVPEVLEELQILSLDLERMPKEWTESGWTDLKTLPYNSVCTTSTHDMPSLRGWWQDLGSEKKEQYLQTISLDNLLDSEDIPESSLMRSVVLRHLESPSMLAILPLADWMSIHSPLTKLQTPEQEQINRPEDPYHRWKYRMPLDVENLAEQYPEWIDEIHRLLGKTQRTFA